MSNKSLITRQARHFRATVIVLDSAGIGVMPNHPPIDDGANTISNTAAYYEAHHPGKFQLPNLQALGLGNIAYVPGVPAAKEPAGSFGVLTLDPVIMTDTITGHWGLMGLNTGVYPTYLSGIPLPLMEKVEADVSKRLGEQIQLLKDGRNISGTTILELVGEKELPIIYTSSDSVFQLAVPVGKEIGPDDSIFENANFFPLLENGKRFAISRSKINRMYDICHACKAFLNESSDPGDKFLRIIARPFAKRATVGPKGEKFVRITSLRKDYTLPVPGETILDHALAVGYQNMGVGKFYDIFSSQGFSSALPDPKEGRHLKGNSEGVDFTLQLLKEENSGIIGVNLVDFDEQFGHRNDPIGYAKALMEFDGRLPEIFAAMGDWDIVMISADHGNDPTRGLTKLWMEKNGLAPAIYQSRGTNHTREFVPLLVFGNPVKRGIDLGIRALADVGATIADYLGFFTSPNGKSLAKNHPLFPSLL
ncbi:MAG: hypothetical protein ABH860_00585 [bacterium]